MAAQNRVVGRGKVYVDKFLPKTQTKTGERYIGNTPALNMTSTYTNLDHYDSDHGLQEKDESVQLRVDRGGTFACDNVNAENIGLLFATSPVLETIVTDTSNTEVFTVQEDRYYQLGVSSDLPDGTANVANVVITDTSGLHATGTVTFLENPAAADTLTLNSQAITFVTTLTAANQVLIGATPTITAQRLMHEINGDPATYDVDASGTENVITLQAIAAGTGGNAIGLVASGANPDVSGATLTGGTASGVVNADGNWEVDELRGRIHILDNPTNIGNGDAISVEYDVITSTRATIIDNQDQAEAALRFIADNPVGGNKDFYWPRVKITPSGEYALKGDSWQTISFNFEVLSPLDGSKRVYVREPVAA